LKKDFIVQLKKIKVSQQVYSDAKKLIEDNQLRECTFKPQINISLRENSKDFEGKPRYEVLYNCHKEKLQKLEDKKKEKEKNT